MPHALPQHHVHPSSSGLPPLARKATSLEAVPQTLLQELANGNTVPQAAIPASQSRAAQDDAPDVAGVPVFVMLPLDTVSHLKHTA